jgi:hypothetical protein
MINYNNFRMNVKNKTPVTAPKSAKTAKEAIIVIAEKDITEI